MYHNQTMSKAVTIFKFVKFYRIWPAQSARQVTISDISKMKISVVYIFGIKLKLILACLLFPTKQSPLNQVVLTTRGSIMG